MKVGMVAVNAVGFADASISAPEVFVGTRCSRVRRRRSPDRAPAGAPERALLPGLAASAGQELLK
jgi:hypothetical protein